MEKLYSNNLLLIDKGEINSELFKIIKNGFIEKKDCVLIKYFLEINDHVSLKDFFDKTDYECFINSINIDDHFEQNYLEQGVLCIRIAFEEFNKSNIDGILNCSMSIDEFGSKLKFHILRDNESWLSEDLEGFEEAILLVSSEESEWS